MVNIFSVKQLDMQSFVICWTLAKMAQVGSVVERKEKMFPRQKRSSGLKPVAMVDIKIVEGTGALLLYKSRATRTTSTAGSVPQSSFALDTNR